MKMNLRTVHSICLATAFITGCEPSALAQCTHPCGLNINHTDGWTAVEDPPDSNVWNITLMLPSLVTDRTYEINWNEGENATRASINRLEITQPGSTGHKLKVSIGGTLRLDAIEEVVVSRVSSGEGGFVWIEALLTSDLGSVYGPSLLIVSTEDGDMGTLGPITCFGHSAKGGIQLLSENGSLRDDVGIFPPPCNVGQGCPDGYVNEPGHIDLLHFQNGVIRRDGEDPKPIEILADEWIQGIYARIIHAEIRGTDTDPTNTDFDAFVNNIADVWANNLTDEDEGVFEGRILAETLDAFDELGGFPWLRFDGAMFGQIWLQQLGSQGSIFFSRNDSPLGLRGTVSLSGRVPGQSNQWLGLVQFRETSPFYLGSADATGYNPERTAASLGGGAIGVAPFLLHDHDCLPKQGETVTPENSPRFSNPIRMRHYGPVTWDPGNGDPFIVERRARGLSGAWLEQDCFTFEPDEENSTIALVYPPEPTPPAAEVALQRGFEYRVSRRTFNNGGNTENILRCDLPHLSTEDDPPVYDYDPLIFSVCDDSPDHAPGDADDSGCVNFADISCVLTNWQSTVCLKLGDADRDGDVDFDDITEVTANFNTPYCGSC